MEILGDFALAAHHRLFEELTSHRDALCARLSLSPSEKPSHVYLFECAEWFKRFMRQHHPAFPDCRAIFVGADVRLIVYAQWGDNVAEDLRHEVTHGYLHSVVPNVPLWLDGGDCRVFRSFPRPGWTELPTLRIARRIDWARAVA
ncbi:MAG: hypothetical protein JW959_09350 [Pirellulales bacterium]|nr:hypothetical protein [Pirellulales bacterium]